MSEQNKDEVVGTLEEIQYVLDQDTFDIVATLALGMVATGTTKLELDDSVLEKAQTVKVRLSHGELGQSKIIEILEG